MNKKQGLFIVFEGIDGSGKTTQIELLSKSLKEKGQAHEVISFPQYGKNEYAVQIKNYLEGKLGKLKEVDPYAMAKLYALDRLTARDLIKSWLMDGKLVIANRFVSANKAHQGANLDVEKKEEFIRWIDKLEYEENGMSKPDLTILLKVDPKVGQKNVAGEHKPDIHEQDLTHLKEANKIYFELSQKEHNWVVVNCMENRRGLFSDENGKMKSKDAISKEIIKVISDKLPT